MLGTLLKWFGGEGGKPASSKAKDIVPESGRSPDRLNQLYAGDRGIYDLADNDAVLRLWLPVPLKTAMDEAIAVMGVTGAKYLREFFVVYLYGAHELLRMKADKTGLYYVPSPKPMISSERSSGVMFSRAATVECIPGLGKNIAATKIKIPQKIKDDLDSLAIRASVPLGQFTRDFDESEFSRRVRVEIQLHEDLFVASTEDNFLRKLRWFQMGGETSDRQWRDVLGLIRVSGGSLDLTYLRHWAKVLGVEDLLERALATKLDA